MVLLITLLMATTCHASRDLALSNVMYTEMYRLAMSHEYEKTYQSLPTGKAKVCLKMQQLGQQLVDLYQQYTVSAPEPVTGSPYRQAPAVREPDDLRRINHEAGEVLKIAMLQIFKVNQIRNGPTPEIRAMAMRHAYPAFFGVNGLSLVLLYLVRPEVIATHPFLEPWGPIVGGVVLYNLFRGFAHVAKFTFNLSRKYRVATLDDATQAFLEPLTDASIPAFSGQEPVLKALDRLTEMSLDTSYHRPRRDREISCEFLMTSPDQLLNP